MLDQVFSLQATTLVDSDVRSTRVYWRRDVWGLPDDIANDRRPLREIIKELDAENTSQ